MAYPGRENIYKATIRRMVSEALAERERAFREQHGSDSNEMLLDYLRHCAKELGHTPWPDEIDGGTLLRERFGCWSDVIRAACLPASKSTESIQTLARVQQETENQQEIYRRKKNKKKLRAQKKEAERKVKRCMHPPKNGGS